MALGKISKRYIIIGYMDLNRVLAVIFALLASFSIAIRFSVVREQSMDFSSYLGPSWLIIGDSHTVGGFGEGLRVGLIQELNNSNLHIYAATGSRFDHWRSGEWQGLNLGSLESQPQKERVRYKNYVNPYWNLDTFLDETKSKNIIFALGTNDMAFAHLNHKKFYQGVLKDSYFVKLKNYLESNSKNWKNCFWILPTYVNEKLFPKDFQDLFYKKLIATVEAHCQIIDSRQLKKPDNDREFLFPTSKDKIHYLRKDGEYWGGRVAKLISQSLRN